MHEINIPRYFTAGYKWLKSVWAREQVWGVGEGGYMHCHMHCGVWVCVYCVTVGIIQVLVFGTRLPYSVLRAQAGGRGQLKCGSGL